MKQRNKIIKHHKWVIFTFIIMLFLQWVFYVYEKSIDSHYVIFFSWLCIGLVKPDHKKYGDHIQTIVHYIGYPLIFVLFIVEFLF